MAADIFAAITLALFFLYEDGMSHRQIVRGGIFDRSIFWSLFTKIKEMSFGPNDLENKKILSEIPKMPHLDSV